MTWQEAIKHSEKGTATHILSRDGFKRTYIMYKDGSGYILVSKNGKVDFELSRPMEYPEISNYVDWQPS